MKLLRIHGSRILDDHKVRDIQAGLHGRRSVEKRMRRVMNGLKSLDHNEKAGRVSINHEEKVEAWTLSLIRMNFMLEILEKFEQKGIAYPDNYSKQPPDEDEDEE